MTMLVAYDSGHVNSCLHIDDSMKLELDCPAKRISEVIFKHGQEDFVAVNRLHHHFSVTDEMIVVTVEDTTGSRKQRTEDAPMLVKRPMKADFTLADDEVLVPLIFRFLPDGKVAPLEFFLGKKSAPAAAVVERAAACLANDEFIVDLHAALREEGLVDALGFQLVFEESVFGVPTGGEVMMEANWDRYQEVVCQTECVDNAVTTSWRFAKLPDDGTHGPRKLVCAPWYGCIRISKYVHDKEYMHT